jgi:hypothetical protein
MQTERAVPSNGHPAESRAGLVARHGLRVERLAAGGTLVWAQLLRAKA